MNKVAISIKMDSTVKDGLQALAEDIGLSFSSIINALAKQAVINRSVTFNAPLEPSDYPKGIIAGSDHEVTHTVGKKEALAHLRSLMTK